MINDDELAEIRRRKMQLMMERAQQPVVLEPLANGLVNELVDANFWQVVGKTKTALVDFSAEWCKPCKALAPILRELAVDRKGKVYFGMMDIDRNRRTATQFGIQSVPMVFAFKNGKPAGSLPGLKPINEYDLLIERLLKEQS